MISWSRYLLRSVIFFPSSWSGMWTDPCMAPWDRSCMVRTSRKILPGEFSFSPCSSRAEYCLRERAAIHRRTRKSTITTMIRRKIMLVVFMVMPKWSAHLAGAAATTSIRAARRGGERRISVPASDRDSRSRDQLYILCRSARRTNNIGDDLFSFVKNIVGRFTLYTSVFKDGHGNDPKFMVVDFNQLLPSRKPELFMREFPRDDPP